MTHPTQEDDVKAIRDALALGPKAWDYDSNQTPFYNDAEGHSRGGDDDGTYCLFGPRFFIDGESYDGPVLSERCSKADANFIAVANPARIARLLARLEQAERRNAVLEIEAETLRTWKADVIKAAEEAHGPGAFRFKLTLRENGSATNRFPKWLDQRWVSFVYAEDDAHIGYIAKAIDAHIAAIASEAKT